MRAIKISHRKSGTHVRSTSAILKIFSSFLFVFRQIILVTLHIFSFHEQIFHENFRRIFLGSTSIFRIFLPFRVQKIVKSRVLKRISLFFFLFFRTRVYFILCPPPLHPSNQIRNNKINHIFRAVLGNKSGDYQFHSGLYACT